MGIFFFYNFNNLTLCRRIKNTFTQKRYAAYPIVQNRLNFTIPTIPFDYHERIGFTNERFFFVLLFLVSWLYREKTTITTQMNFFFFFTLFLLGVDSIKYVFTVLKTRIENDFLTGDTLFETLFL